MFLTARSAVPEDLPGAFRLFEARNSIPKSEWKDIQRMWGQALLEADSYAPLVEDLDRKEGERVVALAINFCVPEAVLDFARTEAPPYLWRWTLGRWRKGQVPWLDKKQARQAQAEGRASYFGFTGLDTIRYAGIELAKVTDMFAMAVSREAAHHRTLYHLNEAQGPAQRDRVKPHGMRVLRDFHEFRDDPDYRTVPEERWPFLMIADFSKAGVDPELKDTVVGRAAVLGPPKFGFSELEQEVMKLALLGMTDQAIAEKLGLTLVAIKKRWEGIIEKANDRAYSRALDKAGNDDEVTKVGRRQVLQMMAEHPEEFWPSPPKKRPAR